MLPHLQEAYTLARWINDAEDVVQRACVRALRTAATASDAKAHDLMLTAVRSAADAWLRKYRSAALFAAEELHRTGG
jgi:RNA polymerase sigma-70 factor (ECF subfamily)